MSSARRLATVQADMEELPPTDATALHTGDLPLVLTLDEVAAVLRVGGDMVQQLVSAKRLRSFKIGRKYTRVYRKALIEYVERRDEEAD